MKKRKLFSVSYGMLLIVFSAFVLLEGFVIPQTYVVAVTESASVEEQAEDSAADTRAGSAAESIDEEKTCGAALSENEEEQAAVPEVSTDTTYRSDGIEITISTYRESDTDIYVADIMLDDAGDLKTAFADNIYGKNVTEPTSEIAEDNDAVLAINGDYYSARSGYVIRNGIIYSDRSADPDQEDLVIYKDGTMEVIREGDITAAELIDSGAVNVFCFGPGLVTGGNVSVSVGEEVSRSKNSNPRTAIGWISDTHYVFVVSDGRTSESEGLSLYELADFMKRLGCETAYNLDGGGSSTMWFNGSVVNNPTSGRSIKERSVSDIVYIGR